MELRNKKFALDVDGVCLEFGQSFIDHCKPFGIELKVGKVWNFFDQNIKSYDIFSNLDDSFWLNLLRIDRSKDLNLTPTAYISHRTCPVEVTRQSLLRAGFPDAPVIHVKYTEDKVKEAKRLGIDVFIDDRASTVLYFLENGIESYAFEQEWNKDYHGVPKIKTLGELDKICV